MHLSPSLSYDPVCRLSVLREMELDVRRHTDTPSSLAPPQLPATHENLASRNGWDGDTTSKETNFRSKNETGKISTTDELIGFCMIIRRRLVCGPETYS